MKELKFNSIFIIESLNNERRTGFELYEDIVRKFKFKFKGFQPFYKSISLKKDFFNYIDKIVDLTLNKGIRPIIHIESHGNHNLKGIIISPSGELIKWSELDQQFRSINNKLQNSLIITLGVCYGSNLIDIIDPLKPSPFFGLIAPKDAISNMDILIGYSEFYKSLLFQDDFMVAIKMILDNNLFSLYGPNKYYEIFDKELLNWVKEEELLNDTKEFLEQAGLSQNYINFKIVYNFIKQKRISIIIESRKRFNIEN